jgi:hypothetical protein
VAAGKDKGRYKLKGLWCWVTSAKSTYDHTRIGEFYEELKKRFPLDNQAKVYGCHELHVDGMSHYHVTLKFKQKFRSGCQRRMLIIPGDTTVVKIIPLKKHQSVSQFLTDIQNYLKRKKILKQGMFTILVNLTRSEKFQWLLQNG